MTVVYADSVFLLNALMDYCVLTAASRLAGVPLHRWRCLWGALIGGGYAVAVFLPGLEWLASPWVKLAAGILMTLAAFGGEPRFLRMALLVLGISCGMAGAVLVLGLVAGGVPMVGGVFYTDVSPRVLLVGATAAYGVLSVVFRASGKHGIRGQLLPVKLVLGERSQSMTALWDTGNGLRDPVTGQAVLVVSPSCVESLVPRGLRFLLEPERLAHPAETLELLSRAAPQLRPRLLPYHAVGTWDGLLLTIRLDWLEIGGGCINRPVVALSPTPLGPGYAALWGGEEKGGVHEGDKRVLASAAELAGPAARGWHPLHRRNGHPAAASGQEPGGGTAGKTGSGGSPEGADRAQSAAGGVHCSEI